MSSPRPGSSTSSRDDEESFDVPFFRAASPSTSTYALGIPSITHRTSRGPGTIISQLISNHNRRGSLPIPRKVVPFPVPKYLKHSAFYDFLYTFSTDSLETQTEEGSRDAMSNAWQNSFIGTSVPTASGDATWKLDEGKVGLPTSWDDKDKSEFVLIGSEGRRVDFNGSNHKAETDAAAVRANRHIPREAGIYYWEVEILSRGRQGYIGIGFSTVNVNLSRLPGWEHDSYGYHGDDGYIFECSGQGSSFGPTFTTGDTIGVGLDWTWDTEGARAFFTKNGRWIDYAFNGIKGAFYPSVGMRTTGESVKVNFGSDPFKFDIEGYVLGRKEQIQRRIEELALCGSTFAFANESLDPTSITSYRGLLSLPTANDQHPFKQQVRLKEAIEDLVQSYLSHEGFWESAKMLKHEREETLDLVLGDQVPSEQKSIPLKEKLEGKRFGWTSEEDVERLETIENLTADFRRYIQEMLTSEESEDPLENVLKVCEEMFEGIFESEKGKIWLFKGRIRKFTEMVLGMGMDLEDDVNDNLDCGNKIEEEEDEGGEGAEEWSDADEGYQHHHQMVESESGHSNGFTGLNGVWNVGATNGSTMDCSTSTSVEIETKKKEAMVMDDVSRNVGDDRDDDEREGIRDDSVDGAEMQVDGVDVDADEFDSKTPRVSGMMLPTLQVVDNALTLSMSDFDGLDHRIAQSFSPSPPRRHFSNLEPSQFTVSEEERSTKVTSQVLSARQRSKMRAHSPFPTLPRYGFEQVLKYGKDLRRMYKLETEPLYGSLLQKASAFLAFDQDRIRRVLKGEIKVEEVGLEEGEGWMIAVDGREMLARELDEVILGSLGMSNQSHLERLFRRTFTILHELGLTGSSATLRL